MRLANADELIKQLYAQADDEGWWVATAKDLEELVNSMLITELITEPEPPWIPCSERLPEINEHHVSDDVLVSTESGAVFQDRAEENVFGNISFTCERFTEADFRVEAWMPLPKRYKADNQ